MLTNYKFALKTGLIVLALSVGACGSSKNSTGTGGAGGHAGGSAGSGGSGGSGGARPARAAARQARRARPVATAVRTRRARRPAPTDGAGDGGSLTPAQENDMIINATGAFGTDYGITITRADAQGLQQRHLHVSTSS